MTPTVDDIVNQYKQITRKVAMCIHARAYHLNEVPQTETHNTYQNAKIDYIPIKVSKYDKQLILLIDETINQ